MGREPLPEVASAEAAMLPGHGVAENQEKELKQGLPPEKFEAFMELAENGFKAKKKKKKKKKKT